MLGPADLGEVAVREAFLVGVAFAFWTSIGAGLALAAGLAAEAPAGGNAVSRIFRASAWNYTTPFR